MNDLSTFFDEEPVAERKPSTKKAPSEKKEPIIKSADMFTEKYRPSTLDEVIGQTKVVSFFKKILSRPQEMQNILLYGNAGGGKTTLAIVFLKELFKDRYDECVLELNASDQRTLETVRDVIKPFAFSMPPPDVPFKVAFLDEFDETAPATQPALRRIIEGLIDQDEPRRCRFIFSCNEKDKVIPPIQSRCVSLFIRPLPLEDVTKCLRQIGLNEGLNKVSFDVLKEIADHSNGDLRKAINTFQTLATLYGNDITVEYVSEVLGVPSQSTVFQILNRALEGKFTEACDLSKNISHDKGFTSESIIIEMSFNLFSLPVKDELRARIASILANSTKYTSTSIMLNGIIAEISLLRESYKPTPREKLRMLSITEKDKVVPL